MKILALDGNSILNRAFYGVPMLSTKNGAYTNAIYGFLRILGKLLDREHPDGVCAAFDLRAPTFRHRRYVGYKAGRKPMPPELASQIPLMKEILRACGYTLFEREGFEADDILGTVARYCGAHDHTCAIATGDRDVFQLINDRTRVLLTTTRQGAPALEEIDRAEIRKRYGVEPKQMIDIKALMGDASDRIPGVAGIGEKTAGELIRRFGHLDTIYRTLAQLDIREPLRARLASGKANAYLSRDLGTIRTDVPLELDDDTLRGTAADRRALRRLFTRLEFFSLLDKVGGEAEPDETERPHGTPFSVSAVFPDTGDTADILADGDRILLCRGHRLFACSADSPEFTALLADERVRIRCGDAKKLYRFCADRGLAANGVTFCTALAGYLLNPTSGAYGVDRLFAEYGAPEPEIIGDATETGAAARFSLLCDRMEAQIRAAGQEKLLREMEIPLARVLADMEKTGFFIDSAGITAYGRILQEKIDTLAGRIFAAVGEPFNLNSPKQLGEALFEKLGLPCKKKTRRGYSTDAEVLEGLRDMHPAVGDLLEYRQLSKLKSTYCDALPAAADENGRVHSTLNQTETRTGRLSSADPNLQNIPVRRPEGRELRRFFRAADGSLLCDADYSQIELRILAHISGDEAMTAAFRNGEDIHLRTAARVFDMPPKLVTPQMRNRAKAVNFGIVYGIGPFSLAKDIGVSRAEADAYIRSYFQTYPGVEAYMRRVVDEAKENGYVSTLYGRRRPLLELTASDARTRAFGERVARNMPIQGTAADLIKIAMIRVFNRLQAEIPAAKLLMQVHDELIVEAPEADAPRAAALLKAEMEGAADFSVPMSVDVHIGKTWYEAKEA